MSRRRCFSSNDNSSNGTFTCTIKTSYDVGDVVLVDNQTEERIVVDLDNGSTKLNVSDYTPIAIVCCSTERAKELGLNGIPCCSIFNHDGGFTQITNKWDLTDVPCCGKYSSQTYAITLITC